MTLLDCKSMPPEELREQVVSRGIPAFRAAQLRTWLDAGATSFEEMTNLPRALQEKFRTFFWIPPVKIEKKLVSQRDNTVKYLYSLADGENVESVLMQYHHGWSQCLSTQVGCRMGCSFCATGMGGFARNLLASEMIGQIEAAQKDTGVRVSSVVLMGMGEPLDNFDNVLRFLQMLSEPGGVHIGMRHVSLSTCGLVDQIYRLMDQNLQLTLSVSLHAPNDELRSRMMPINRRWPVEQLMQACRDYFRTTGRRISFEYALIKGVNDSPADAQKLAKLLDGMICHVNLIPVNPVKERGYDRTAQQDIRRFVDTLGRLGVNATVRRELGSDINAACGQLRRQYEQGEEAKA